MERPRPIVINADDYKSRNVVERCFSRLKQWRGIAMRSDKTARNYHAALCLAATLLWAESPRPVADSCGGQEPATALTTDSLPRRLHTPRGGTREASQRHVPVRRENPAG